MPPVAVQTDTEQKGYKNHRPPSKRENTREEKQYTLSGDVVQCKHAHRFLNLEELSTVLSWNTILPQICA